jgi:hypothetical protein
MKNKRKEGERNFTLLESTEKWGYGSYVIDRQPQNTSLDRDATTGQSGTLVVHNYKIPYYGAFDAETGRYSKGCT